MNWVYFGLNVSIVFTNISLVLMAWQCRKLTKRIATIEQVSYLRDWIKSIEDGESLSDIAYMKEKGFLK